MEKLKMNHYTERNYESDKLNKTAEIDEKNEIDLKDSLLLPQSSAFDLNIISVTSTKKEVTRGHKITGEEYEAVSIDVQTEESWLMNGIENLERASCQDINQNILLSKPSLPVCLKYFGQNFLNNDLNASDAEKTQCTDISSTADFIGLEENFTHNWSRLSSRQSPSIDFDFITDKENPIIEKNVNDSILLNSADFSSDEGDHVLTVQLPFILKYKKESEKIDVNYAKLKAPILTPITTVNDLNQDNQDYYQRIIEEAKKNKDFHTKKRSSLINVKPHDVFSTNQAKKDEKKRIIAKTKVKEAEKKKQMEIQTANQANFYSFARQLKTLNYSLSSEKCMDEGWTIKPKTPNLHMELEKKFYIQEPIADVVSGKHYQKSFHQKYYDNGNKFLSIFPDGTGTVWYLSGNVAISIVGTKKKGKLIYIVHEDKEIDENPCIQAIFKPNGNCTCYYPNGTIRTNLNLFGGKYYSLQGERLKHWQWKNNETHVHAPPFQPITFGITKQVGVRIIAQENIFLTFTDGRRNIRFNVGTKLRLKSGFPTKDELIDFNMVMLEEKIIYIQSLLHQYYCTFQFPHSPRRTQIKLPYYLSNKIEKFSKICSSLKKLSSMKNSPIPFRFQTSCSIPKQFKIVPPISKKSKLCLKEEIEKKPLTQFSVTVD